MMGGTTHSQMVVRIGGRKAGKATALRKAYLASIRTVCREPVARCVEAGEHVPVCRCILEAGHAGRHTDQDWDSL
jgi:hypothetical protein